MSENLAPKRTYELNAEYYLYLVTDSSDAILKGRDLFDVVEAALKGGVGIVQYREKKLDARAMVAQAKRLVKLCHEYKATFIVNDRVDVAFAAGADGVHLGQDDISIKDARQILGDDVIVGVSCSTVDEALQAIKDGADYLGVGAVYATPTKSNVSGILGVSGIREIVSAVARATKDSRYVPCVAIGGLNATNIQLLRHKCHTTEGYLEGVAIVSAIMGADSPQAAAHELRTMLFRDPPWLSSVDYNERKYSSNVKDMLKVAAQVSQALVKTNPITHNMTNIVVANFTANVAIASGASPIMSKAIEEVSDLAKLGGGLVVNIGTSTPDDLPTFIAGIQAYNKAGGPVLLDPVGAGATRMRYDMITQLMNRGYTDIIKGNENELQALSSAFSGKQKGVDSTGSDLDSYGKATIVSTLARRERCVVLMTGSTDYLSDGARTYVIKNGVANLGNITGSGCALGALIVAFMAVNKDDKLLATLAAVLFYEIASEMTLGSDSCKGPGSFIPCFMDALKQLNDSCRNGDTAWLSKAKVEELVPCEDSSSGSEWTLREDR